MPEHKRLKQEDLHSTSSLEDAHFIVYEEDREVIAMLVHAT